MKKKSFALSVFLLSLFMLIITGCNKNDSTTQKNQFNVVINYGIDSRVSNTGDVPVYINITNKGDDFSGKVVVMEKNEYSMNVGICKSISVAGGGKISTNIELPVKNGYYETQYIVQIRDNKENVLYEHKIQPSYVVENEDALLVGVLSDDDTAFNYLDGYMQQFEADNSDKKQLIICRIDEKTMPDTVSVLNNLRIIIIDDFDTSKLSDEQYNALKKWTSSGGLLLLGTGNAYNKVLSKFNDGFINGSIGKVSNETIAFTSGEQKLDVVDLKIDSALYVNEFGEGKMLLEKNIGSGKAAVFKGSFVLGNCDKAVVSEAIEKLIRKDIYSYCVYSPWSYSFDYLENRVSSRELPKMQKYALLFLVYIVLVGPILFLILKLKEKTKLIWVLIPAVSLVFTGIVFLLGIKDTVRAPFIDYAIIEYYSDGSVEKNLTLAYTNPKSTPSSFKILPEWGKITTSLENGYTNSDITCMIEEENDGTEISLDKMNSFTEIYFNSLTTEKTDKSMSLVINEQSNGFTGSVTNNCGCRLRDVVVYNILYNSGYYSYIPSIEDGETVNIEMDENQNSVMYYSDISYDLVKKYKLNQNEAEIISQTRQYVSSNKNSVNVSCYVVGIKDSKTPKIASGNVDEQGFEIVVKEADNAGKNFTRNIYYNYMTYSTDNWDLDNGYMYDGDAEVEYSFADSGINYISIDSSNSIYAPSSYAETYIYSPEIGKYERIFVGTDECDITKYYIDNNLKNIRLIFKYNKNSDTYVPNIGGGIR